MQVHWPQTALLGLHRDCNLDYNPLVRVTTLKDMSGWGRVRSSRARCIELAGLISVVTRQGFDTDGTKISLGINIPIKIKQPKKLNQLNSHYCELQDLPEFPKQK